MVFLRGAKVYNVALEFPLLAGTNVSRPLNLYSPENGVIVVQDDIYQDTKLNLILPTTLSH